MDYTELQEKAKSLGLPYVSVSRVDLEASIAAAEAKNPNPPTEPIVPSIPEPQVPSGTPPLEPTQPVNPSTPEEETPAVPVNKTEETPGKKEELTPKQIKDAEKAAKKKEADEKAKIAKQKKDAEEEGQRKLKEQEAIAEADRVAKEKEAAEIKAKQEEVPADTNTAVVKDGGNVVRVYSEELHGEGFAKLAKTFISTRPNMRIEYSNKSAVSVCPNCGSEIKCQNCGSAILTS